MKDINETIPSNDIDQGEARSRGHACSCGSQASDEKKQPINIFNEIAYLTEHMSNLGEDEVQRILDEFLAENDTPAPGAES